MLSDLSRGVLFPKVAFADLSTGAMFSNVDFSDLSMGAMFFKVASSSDFEQEEKRRIV